MERARQNPSIPLLVEPGRADGAVLRAAAVGAGGQDPVGEHGQSTITSTTALDALRLVADRLAGEHRAGAFLFGFRSPGSSPTGSFRGEEPPARPLHTPDGAAARRGRHRVAGRLREAGLEGRYLDQRFGFSLPFTLTGVIIAESFVSMPFFMITLEAGLRSMNRAGSGGRNLGRRDGWSSAGSRCRGSGRRSWPGACSPGPRTRRVRRDDHIRRQPQASRSPSRWPSTSARAPARWTRQSH